MRISFPLTLLMLALVAAFIGLGRWQWQRGEAREAQWESFANATGEPLPLGPRGLAELERFQWVRLHGRYDAARQFLLDNRTHEGQAGYEVLTPFMTSDGRTVLVNRGWVPFTGFRERLPDVAFEAGTTEVVGRIDELPSGGLESGRSPPPGGEDWPKLTSFPSIEELSAALGRKIEPRIVLLDPKSESGYVRDWHPPGLSPTRHWSYAFQWWSFAAALIVVWMILTLRRGRRAR